MLTYLAIFTAKILENTLATLRIILVSNGKKTLGAIIQGLVTLLWILVTGTVIINLNNNFYKIIVFCLGASIGSYLGNVLEEKIALGQNTIITIIHNKEIFNIINKYKYRIINKDSEQLTILLIVPRKDTAIINKKIYQIDNNALITNLRTKNYKKYRKD